MKKRVFLFTAAFPFEQTESFLEEEIGYLCREFEQVVITPLYGSMRTREVPDNCVVNSPILPSAKLRNYATALLPNRAFPLYAKEFFTHRVWSSARRLKSWLISYAQSCNILRSKSVKTILSEATAEDVLYFYWGKGSNIIPLFYPGKYTSVGRFHGEWDLWEESCGGYAPLRDKLSKRLDLALFISERGKEYYETKYPGNPTALSRLGARDCGLGMRSDDGTLRILSCSTIYPLKRVPLILQAVKSLQGKDVEWTHIGGGPDLEAVQKMAAEANNPRLKINLMGQMSHDEVIEYYRTHRIDLFINLSTNEGIPVTIMEAISFGVPVIATNVGGTSEIVNDQTGILLAADPALDQILSAIEEIVHKTTDPRGYWEQYYNAEKNYTEFTRIIKSIERR